MSDDELQNTLTQLGVLTSGQPHISAFLKELRSACATDWSKVQGLVSDLRLWGGMGSVADQAGCDLSPDGRRRVNELLIRLYELLEDRGITDVRGASWVDTFRKWRDSYVFGLGNA